jgi:putative NIF3 family GTP cyclohydrolase 1 type 2
MFSEKYREGKSALSITVQQVIDTILESIPGAPFEDTVDTIKTGDPSQEVTGIVTTFLASCEVIQQAIELGANFIITHEPTFYNHPDETDWLQDDSVYQAKRKLIDDHQLVIWRFHDYWHSHQPDGINTGMLNVLGWSDYAQSERPLIVTIPPVSLTDLVRHLKNRLGAHTVRVMGQPDMVCQRVGLLVGFPGGQWQILTLGGDIDVLVAGEINEWETCEYVRDALYQGQYTALIILGHSLSEEAGMAYLVEWLRPCMPGVTITHIPTGDPFRFE